MQSSAGQSEDRRQEIVGYLLESGLVERCVKYQTNRCRNKELVKEITQETWLWIMTYDIDKLCDAYDNNHLNALITRYLCNQWFSRNSPFYKNFRKFDAITDELSSKEYDIPDG